MIPLARSARPSELRTLRALLARAGYEVLTASSAVDALAAVDDPANRPPSVVLVDRHLPDGDGVELGVRLRAHRATRSSRLVLLSGAPTPPDAAPHFDACLLKPAGVADVLAAVRGDRG